MVTSITLITMVTVVTLDRFAKGVCRDLQTGATAAGVPLWGSRRSIGVWGQYQIAACLTASLVIG
jgi:hypothetical protein